MDCSLPPPLTDDQLSAALDDNAEPAVIDHLARCPSCARRLSEARRFEQALGAVLYRWDCPPPQALADYHLARVGPDEDRAIRMHLAECARCREEVEQLRLFLLAEEPAAPAPPAPARARWPRGWSRARLVPRAAAPALRGAAAGPLMFQADGSVTIFLDVQMDAAGQATLRGQLVADDQERWTGALVEVRQSGALRATAAIDDLGGWSCAALPLAATELRITRPDGRVIVLPEFELMP